MNLDLSRNLQAYSKASREGKIGGIQLTLRNRSFFLMHQHRGSAHETDRQDGSLH